MKERPLTTSSSENPVGLGYISPDGKYLAYSDRMGLHLKPIESGDERPIPRPEGLTTENGVWWASHWFSDGTRFLASRHDATGNRSTWVVSMLGGPPRLLRDNADSGAPAPDGSQILYMSGSAMGMNMSELWLMGAQGENPRRLLTAATGESFNWAIWSPDGRRFAYLRYRGKQCSIESCDLKGEEVITVLSDPGLAPESLWWLSGGRLIFTAAAPENQFDFSLWEIQVDPCRVARRVKLSSSARLT